MAELVARALRQQIVDGRLHDGDRLPKQDELAERFDISGPSVREGLRILEAEGLITVRRGKLKVLWDRKFSYDSPFFAVGLAARTANPIARRFISILVDERAKLNGSARPSVATLEHA